MISYIKKLREMNAGFVPVIKYIYYKAFGKNIFACRRTIIKGWRNIDTNGSNLLIGTRYIGFVHDKDYTLLNVCGKLKLNGTFAIERGCRIDVGKNALVDLGAYSFINPLTKVIIQHGLKIGDNCSIGWECCFIDDDFHRLEYDGKKCSDENKIVIGNKVWIGSSVSVYKGVKIPDGCVVAANSIVKDSFEEENVLLAGNPARIVKRNISWS